jgi:hypothetical protein
MLIGSFLSEEHLDIYIKLEPLTTARAQLN